MRLRFVAAALLLAGCSADLHERLAEELARSNAPRRIDVLFLGHADTTHNARELAPILAAALGRNGIDLDYTEDPGDDLVLFDAVIVFAQFPELTRDKQNALLKYVERGGGLLAIHFTPDSARSVEDRVLRELRLRPADDAAPADTSVHTRTSGRGRIAVMAEGHAESEWSDPSFQRRVQETLLHVVGGEVVAKWLALELPPLQYEPPPVLIPNYENRPQPPQLQLPLSPEDALNYWQVPPGFEVQLFAAEPDIVNPIAMTWDERGRLWVIETVDYPNNLVPDGQGHDVIRILEDTDSDGRADRNTVFAEGLSIATGLVFADSGVIVSNAPRFLFLEDTTGDDRVDVRREILTGWRVADTHGGPSNLQYGFDNRVWGSVGDAGFDGVVGGRRMRFEDAIYRMRPDGSELEVVARFSNNTWALGFSENFDIFTNTANNEHSVFVAIPERYREVSGGLRGQGWARLDGHYARHAIALTRQVDYFGGFTAAGGHSLYTARSFPREYWNRIAFVHEAIGGLVHRAIIERHGSGFRERDGWNLVASADEWAAPVHAQVGPDGAVWFLDWYSFIKQHNPTPPGFTTGAGGAYETPLRDKQRGRIYRIVWKGAPPYQPLSLSRDRPDELVAALRHENMFWRMTAQRLLVERAHTDVVPRLVRIVEDRSVDEIGLNAPAVHALWTLHGLGVLKEGDERTARVLETALAHPAAGVRKNALMVMPREPAAFQRIVRARVLNDADPAVRLQAFLTLADLPPNDSVGRALFDVSRDASLLEDQWLPAALYHAASRHADGFLAAYAERIGTAAFQQLTQRAARGQLEQAVDWSAPELDDAAWDTVRVPAHWTTTKLAHFPGVVWFRREIELPASTAGASAVLHLGPISDADVSYVNGVRVGAMDNVPGEARAYAVPRSVLRAGTNVIAVEVTNRRRGGGIYGPEDSVYLAGPGFRIPLAGHWKYRKAAEWIGGRPPDFTPGTPFAQQLLRIRYRRDIAAAADVDAAPPDVTLSLATVPGAMRFTKTMLTVRAGQRVALRFENPDAMPHNVVILSEPGGDRQDIGAMLNAFVSDASAAGRDFVPPRLPVLVSSAMVSAREADTVVFNAPAETGDYPFLCTVPGHWVTMWGILRVTN